MQSHFVVKCFGLVAMLIPSTLGCISQPSFLGAPLSPSPTLSKYQLCSNPETDSFICVSDTIGCSSQYSTLVESGIESYSKCQEAVPEPTMYRRCYNPMASEEEDKVHCHLGQCPEGEQWLTTGGQVTFVDAASCDNWRYMARACYVPLSPPNINEFTIVSVWDWQGGKCQGIGKLLTSEWFHGNSIVDVEGLATAFYDDDLPLFHQRCLAHTGSVICRPVIHEGGCGIGETKLTSTGPQAWNSLGECQQDLYFSILCYNTTEPVMHDSANLPNMVCVADYLHGSCPAGLRQIKSYSSSVDQDDATSQCQAWNSDSSIEWSVCIPGSNDGRYCRPKSIGCINNEETDVENTESTFVSLDLCLNAQFHVCGLTDPFMNPIYDGGAARAAGSCQWLNDSISGSTCGDNIDYGGFNSQKECLEKAENIYEWKTGWIRCTGTTPADQEGSVQCMPDSYACPDGFTTHASGPFTTFEDCITVEPTFALCMHKSSTWLPINDLDSWNDYSFNQSASWQCAEVKNVDSLPCSGDYMMVGRESLLEAVKNVENLEAGSFEFMKYKLWSQLLGSQNSACHYARLEVERELLFTKLPKSATWPCPIHSSRISGGFDAPSGTFPFLVSIDTGDYRQGVIIDSETVLSYTEGTRIAYGLQPGQSAAEIFASSTRVVDVISTNYTSDRGLAVMKVSPPMQLGPDAVPIKFSNCDGPSKGIVGESLAYFSLGYTSTGVYADTVQVKCGEVLEKTPECISAAISSGYNNTLCLAATPCYKDWGSPFVTVHDDDYYLLAFVRWGIDNCSPDNVYLSQISVCESYDELMSLI